MRILNFFKKKPKLIDDVFGELAYTIVKDTSKNFYDGEVSFQKRFIGIAIDADGNGPTNKQKEFFKNLDKNYNEIKDTVIIPFLKKELEDYVIESGLDDFNNTFELDGISIGQIINNEVEWSVAYYSKPMRHSVSIYFEKMKPKYITIDG